MALGRREVLRSGWRIGGGVLAFVAGWTVWESLRPLAGGATTGPVKLGNAGRFQPGTVTYVPEARLYVTNPGDGPMALLQKCPHLGCRVPYCESSGRFECGCHGSVFDLGGEWIAGPSPRGMTRVPVTTQGNDLYADTSTQTPGPPRGSDQYLSPAKGPSCLNSGG